MLPRALAEIVDDELDLSGQWRGSYGPHGDETIAIKHEGAEVLAIKVTGDPYVPAGEITFKATLAGWGGAGEGQIADRGHANARFVKGWLSILGRDRIAFEWKGFGRVVLRRLS